MVIGNVLCEEEAVLTWLAAAAAKIFVAASRCRFKFFLKNQPVFATRKADRKVTIKVITRSILQSRGVNVQWEEVVMNNQIGPCFQAWFKTPSDADEPTNITEPYYSHFLALLTDTHISTLKKLK